MLSVKFLSPTMLFTPQVCSWSQVQQKPQPLAQSASGPLPWQLSLQTDIQTWSDLSAYCSWILQMKKIYNSYFLSCGMTVHSCGLVQHCRQLYCSECTPEQGANSVGRAMQTYFVIGFSTVNKLITCSLRGSIELSTKVNILKMKRLKWPGNSRPEDASTGTSWDK